ncbi:ShlB/FhaC/HecB family hemolysin secretion/activation protein [Pleurocapsales cyanobacterium LEGE 06147]|nr:ShlB/FhaC/HecB family hemolysin secretion/activation protein [Pleurocapsales cyanobacterium LEGE 06147]
MQKILLNLLFLKPYWTFTPVLLLSLGIGNKVAASTVEVVPRKDNNLSASPRPQKPLPATTTKLAQLPSPLPETIPPVEPRPFPRPEPQPLPPPEDFLEEPTPTPPIPEVPPELPGTITVKEFNVVGSTVFSPEELEKVLADFTNRPLTFAELLQAEAAITRLYVENGYINSGAIIPPQTPKEGIVTVQVIEGSLEDIQVTTSGRLNPNYVRSRLAIASGPPLNVNRLQEALQLLQLDPLINNLSAQLSVGSSREQWLLEVEVEQTPAFRPGIFANNYRNPSIGTFERGVELNHLNLLGQGDALNFAYKNTDGSNEFDGRYTFPINPYNGTVGFRFRTIDNEIVEPPFDDLDIESDTNYYDFVFRQPIIRTASSDFSQELAFGLTFSRAENETSLLGEPFPISQGANQEGETRLSALRFFQEWTGRGRNDVILARSQFNLGIGAFDATINNEEPDSRFFAWRGQGQWLHLLARDTLFLLRSDVQLSTTSLVPMEQFGLGGFYTVRGYRQDALVTDNGIVASAEVRLPIARVPEVQGILQLTPFIDFGVGWNTDRDVPFDKNTLVGAGLGLLWQSGNNLTARFDWGIPLVDIDSRDRTWQEQGLYLSLQWNFF